MTGVYLSYPIDQASSSETASLRAFLAQRALQDVSWVFDPGRAFSVASGAPSWPVRDINLKALSDADLLIAVLPAGVSSVGVPMEIHEAVSVGKPVILISNAPSWMLEFTESQPVYRIYTLDISSVDHKLLDLGNLSDWAASFKHTSPGMLANERDTPLQFQLLGGGAALPTYAYPDDAGLDLIVSRDTVVNPGEFTDIPSEIAVELPEHTWGMITGRSSTLRKLGLLLPMSVIDAGYRGPLFSGAWNLTRGPVHVKAGDRVAQLILVGNETRYFVPVGSQADLKPSSRGNNGFGSSGK